MNTKGQILEMVTAFNESWQAGETDRLGQYLHDQVVFVNARGEGNVKGKEKCLATFVELSSTTIIRQFKRHHERVELWGKTAVASYEFSLGYRSEGQEIVESGRDILVFNQSAEGWKMVYRTLLPF